MTHWGSELGLQVLAGLSRLYTSLVWESTVLLALCSEDTLPQDCMFGRQVKTAYCFICHGWEMNIKMSTVGHGEVSCQ